MEDETFCQRLIHWDVMPGELEEHEYFMSLYPAPLDAKFHALSALYLLGSQEQRRSLIDCFANNTDDSAVSSTFDSVVNSPISGTALSFPHSTYTRFDNVIIYMRRVARSLRSTTDSFLLRLGLAAATLTENRVESHDLLVSLAFLYYSASRAGIDPVPEFGRIAAIASPQIQEALQAFLHSDLATVKRMVQHYEGTC
jgi:hypothetical protein